MTVLRCVCGLCLLFGCFFSLFAWVFIPLPIGILMPEYQFTMRDSVLSVIGSILAISGYFVWLSWAHFLFKARFPILSPVAFSLLVLANHVGWFIVLPFIRHQNVLGLCLDLPLVVSWIILNSSIGLVMLVHFNLEQSVTSN